MDPVVKPSNVKAFSILLCILGIVAILIGYAIMALPDSGDDAARMAAAFGSIDAAKSAGLVQFVLGIGYLPLGILIFAAHQGKHGLYILSTILLGSGILHNGYQLAVGAGYLPAVLSAALGIAALTLLWSRASRSYFAAQVANRPATSSG